MAMAISSSSKRSGIPHAAGTRSSSSSSASDVNLMYSKSRLRPINQRVASSSTYSEQESMGQVSLDSLQSSSIEGAFTGTAVTGARTPQRARLQRSLTSPMQSETAGIHYASPESMQDHSNTRSSRQQAKFSPQFEDAQEEEPDEWQPEQAEGDGYQEATSEEYVVALHDFSSTNATCLSFQAGQVIKVFNRDESGWWDGELNGQRGWFPSNYVDEDAITSTAEGQTSVVGDIAVDTEHSTGASSSMVWPHARPTTSSSTSSTSPSLPPQNRNRQAMLFSSSSSSVASGQNAPYSRTTVMYPSRTPTPTGNAHFSSNRSTTILDPIHHAISLLHNAVRANRVAHFQPSTACVISSVRSVLSGTDCLTRESSVLKAHPVLAKERKQILAELSKLVTQARTASSPLVVESHREQEMDVMLSLADLVLRNVRRFLEVAIECGVTVPDRRSSVYDDLYEGQRRAPSRNLFSPPLDRSDQDKTPTPESPRTSIQHPAASLHTATVHRESQPFTLAGHSDPHAATYVPNQPLAPFEVERARSDSLLSDVQEVSSSIDHSLAGSASGSGSGSGSGSRSDSGSGTSPSGSCDSLTDDAAANSGGLASSPTSFKCSPNEVHDRLQQANDQLLSIIAAFIGHIHSHTRDSHASSYAFLIDMTRATVDGVRNLLVVVEAVHSNATLRAQLPGQMGILWETRESVYEATAALVTAARIITSTSTTADGVATSVFANEEEEKARLLQTATSVLRTGGECIGAVKLCLKRASPNLAIVVSPLAPAPPMHGRRPSEAASVAATSSVDEETLLDVEEGVDEVAERPRQHGIKRGQHTLSLLGRKATSLSCLREKYESEDRSGGTALSSTAEESDIGEYIEELEGLQLSKRTIRLDSHSEGSDGSEPMSRDHSRTSGSTLLSGPSDTTCNTSTRPSFERAEHGKGFGEEHLSASGHSVRGASARTDSESTSETSHASVRGPSHAHHHRSASQTIRSDGQGKQASPIRALQQPPRSTASEEEETDVCYNSEGQLTGATLPVLVEKITPHDTTIEATFSNTFFLCFRLFTTPLELFEVLETRYNMRAPVEIEMNSDEFTRWMEFKVAPIRLRVFNFLKMWLESHWNAATDYVILERLIHFIQTSMTHSLHRPGQRLAELAYKRQANSNGSSDGSTPAASPTSPSSASSSTFGRGAGSLMRIMSADRVKMGAALTPQDIANMYPTSVAARVQGGVTLPTPIVSKHLLTSLRTTSGVAKLSICDFDPTELARQLTIMESKIYCSIMPQELLGQEFSKKAGISSAVNVKKMSALSTHITGWISECILSEEDARKRTSLIKFLVKLGDRCLSLNNFNTLMAIQCALNSSTIARLKKTWDGLPTKYRQMMDHQRKSIEHTRNFAGYRQTLRQTMAPALPFVGLFLTDLTFCHEGNAPTRTSPADPSKKLLNFDKYVKMSRIIGDLQRFQVAYNLVEVPEIQLYLQRTLQEVQQGKGAGTADDLYRRSLRLEPRSNGAYFDTNHHPSPATISIGRSGGGGSDSKLGLDLFNWK